VATFYLDNDCTRLARPWHALGHTVITTPEQQMETAEDALQLARAAARGWTFVTHNREHFVLLHRAWLAWQLPPHGGLLILVQHQAWPFLRLADEVHRFVLTGRPRPNECWRLRVDGTWVLC